MKRLIETGKELSIGLPARLPDVERYSSQHYIPFKSRESKYKELLDALKDDSNYVIGLNGMEGTGKTTLAKEVCKELQQSKQFTQIIDTTVSFSPDIKRIQDDIAGPLGLKFDHCNESDRPKKLWSRLTNGEKILLILNDVWGDINFVEIGIPEIDNNKGCRILVTMRNLSECNRLGCSKTIQLDILSEEDAWIMFKGHAGLSEISTKILLDKGSKIANECKGLPISIAAIASSLKGMRRLEEWEWTLKSLQKNMPMHNADDDLANIYKCLKFSYDNMNEKAKRLLLLCSVFRKDEKIPTERLTRFGVGGGLFGEDYVSYEDARIQVVISKNKLLDSCLLLEADQSRVKMHDLVRDAAQWIANKEIQTVKLYDKNQKAMVERETNIKYLLCEGKLKDVFSLKLDGSKLEILTVIVHQDEDCHDVKVVVLNSFFENSTGLQVFHLIYDHYSNLSLSLPRSIQSLKNIRSLLFAHVDLGDISILGNLQSLETLDLDGCKIDELPHGIKKLEKLKLLNLNHCGIARNNPFEVIEGCSSLEELYFRGSFNDFCQEISFPKLQRFYIDEYLSSVDESSSKCVSLANKDGVFLSETTLKYCLQEAEVLRLARIEGEWRNIIPEIVPLDQGMNDLVELSLSCISQLQCLIDTKHTESQVSRVFSKLVVLELEGMDNLEELFNDPLSFDSLNYLENLSIEDCKHLRTLFKCNINLFYLKSVQFSRCPMLISLFQLSTAVSLVSLERLEIINCERLQNIIIDQNVGEKSRGEIIDDNESTIQGSMFQKLEVLSIKKCPELKIILPFQSSHDLPALESITIESCDMLKYIFGKDVKFGSLKKMELGGIPNFIDIFPECYRTMSLSIKKPFKCNMFSWTDIYCCGKKYGHNKLRSAKVPLVSEEQPHDNLMEPNSYCLNIWELHAQCLTRQSHILCNIKEITLKNISKMKSVFILSMAPRMLLESLTISKCDELKHIIIDTRDHDSGDNNLGIVFPRLNELAVDNCVQLEYIFGCYNDDHQTHTENHIHLPALEGLCLQNLPSLVDMCPIQYRTTFPPLKGLKLGECPQFNIKSIGDFITHHLVIRSVDDTVIKESSGNMDIFLALERLVVNNNSKVESIICQLNEIYEQPMHLALKDIDLDVLPMMTWFFVGPKNSFFLRNLTHLKIMRCEKLKIVFPTSIVRCLPQVVSMRIEECNELKHIIEDDLENTTKTCFPKLRKLVVVKCNKLKYVFPISICKELPELQGLIIREADELDEIFADEGDDQKVMIPNLIFVVFENLPSLSHVQGSQFQAVKYRFVQNCQELSLASTSTSDLENDIDDLEFGNDDEFFDIVRKLFSQLHDESKGHETCSEISEVQTASGNELTSSQKEMEQTLEIEHEFVENVPQQAMSSVAIVPTNSELEGSTSKKNVASTLATISETTRNELPIQLATSKQKGIKLSFEDVDLGSSHETPLTNNNQVSLNDDAFTKVSSNIEKQFPNDVEIIVSKSKPSSITSPIASQFPSISSKDFDLYLHMERVYRQFQSRSKGHENGNENPNAQTTKEFAAWVEAEAASRHVLASSKELINEQSMDQQCLMNQKNSLEETDTTNKPSHGNNFVKNTENQSIQDRSTSEKTEAATLFTISEIKNEPPIPLVAPIKKGVEEGNTLTNAETVTPSAHLELVSSSEEQDVDVRGSQEITKTNNDQVSLNDDAFIQLNSIIEEQIPKDDDFRDSKSKPSPSKTIALRRTSQTLSMPFKGNLSQIMENSSSPSIVICELQQLVSKNYFDYENLSLLTDFLVKHPSVLLRDASLSNKYKGYAYGCLAELLQFLQTHSVLDVLGSSHSKFVKLLQDVRSFAFDKDWLDGVEKRALFPDFQFSQNALEKLLDSQQHLTKEVEEMRLKINILNQHVEDLQHQLKVSEGVLETIIQQKAQVLETKATLSAPIGY